MAEQQPNAAAEINRRRQMAEEQAKREAMANDPGADKQHRMNVPAKETKSAAMIHPTRMKIAEYERNDWIVNAELTHTIDDILRPGYWAHMAQQMQPYDHIEVRAEDGAWIAELIVVETDRSWAKVILTRKYDLVPTESLPEAEPLHKVEWKGPQHRYCVIRLSDGERVQSEFKTKEAAAEWMKNHERIVQQ